MERSKGALRGRDLLVGLVIGVILAALVVGWQRLDGLTRQQSAIVDELAAIKASRPGSSAKAAAQRKPVSAAALSSTVSIAGAIARGSDRAPLTLVEFSDFECPYCRRYALETYPQLIRDYVDKGLIRYVFRHYPLERAHPHALAAAAAAECASRQGKFWELHDRFFASPLAVPSPEFDRLASDLGISSTALGQCLRVDGPDRVKADIQAGREQGITGTPFFVIGKSVEGDELPVLKRLSGAQPYGVFSTTLSNLLASL